MKSVRLLLGIDDTEYAQRLLALLMAQGFGDGVHLYTDPEFFGEEMEELASGTYDAAILTTAFFEEAQICGIREKIEQCIPNVRHLLSSPSEEAKTEAVLYRYRPASALLDLLDRLSNHQERMPAVSFLYEKPVPLSAKTSEEKKKTKGTDRPLRWIWVSPCRHELLEATALLAAKEWARSGPVWLADLQQNSMLDRILRRSDAKTATDAVYLLGSHDDSLPECASVWEGVRMLLPASSLQEIGQLTKEHWKLLDEALLREQAPCFLLMDAGGPGFELLMENSDRCVVVTRDEPNCRKSEERLAHYMQERFPSCPVQLLSVPFSAGGIDHSLWTQTVLQDDRLLNIVQAECCGSGKEEIAIQKPGVSEGEYEK